MVELYPIFLNVEARPVLIIGGGAVGLRKAQSLLATGAQVTVLSPEFHGGFDRLTSIHRMVSIYEPGVLTAQHHPKWMLIFAATNSPHVNAAVMQDAVKAGILCCRCDEPASGDFISPAVQRRGPLTLALTSGGSAPGLSAAIAENLSAAIDSTLIAQLELLARWRRIVLERVSAAEVRRNLLQRLSGHEMYDMIRTGGQAGGEEMFAQWLAAAVAQCGLPPSAAVDSRK